MSSDLIERFIVKVTALPVEQQREVLEYIESLAVRHAKEQTTCERKSLLRAFAHMGLSVTDKDIEDVRREMWR